MNPIDSLTKFLKPDQIKSDEASKQYYGKDWTTYFDIRCSAVVFPESENDVVKLVNWSRQTKIPLVPSGGRTGLSGAAVATAQEVIVSFERMNQILDYSPLDSLVRIQPGVITENLQKFAREQNRLYPVDFAARGSSHVAGNVATNAGGIKVLRYGMTRDWVMGLRVVTGRGEVLSLNQGLVKNATGYDLRQLIVGSEGTLGFVTEALMRLAPRPPDLKVFILALSNLDSVMNVFAEFQQQVTLTAFEMFSDLALQKVLAQTKLPRPLASEAPYYVVVEFESPSAESEEQGLGVFERCVEKEWVVDGALAASEVQAQTFWRYREDISESLAPFSPYKNDVAVRVSRVPDFLQELDLILKKAYPSWEVVWFGHVGDGNLHINILRPPGLSKEQFVSDCRQVDQLVFECVEKFQGSISAEHGVGLTKKSFLFHSRSPEEIAMMKAIKAVFDPDHILNPGKIF